MKRIDFFRLWRHYGCWILTLWLAVVGTTWAQRTMPPAPPMLPTLRLATPGAQLQPSTPVHLESIRIDTEIAGSRAVTAVEMQFRNPNARVLEGELQFPLLDGQEVVGFALDIDGRLRDAVPVEKAKGQAVFEDTIRARIDPALLEKTVGNNFKLRVYPLPPHGTRRVLLRYAETLPVDHGLRVYRLPLDYARKLNSFALRILVQAAEFAPQLAGARPQGLSFDLKGIDYQAQVERKDFSAQGVLEVRLPQPTRPEVVTQTVGDKTYFIAEVPASSETAARSLPTQVGLLWDASGSGAKRDREREFAVLEAYFKKMGQGVVHLVRFRDAPEAVQRFEIRQGQWTELRRALESTPYDGATYLGGLKPLAGVGEYLLFSDGLQNYGDDRLPRFDAPVFVCAAAVQSDPTRLRHIAASSGGRYIDLNAVDAHSAAKSLLTRQEHIVELGGDGVARLVMASNYADNGRWRIAGELTKDAATLRLNLNGGKAPRILTVPLKREGRVAGFAASAWAALRIAELEAEASTNRAEIRR
ncbi:MAG TPA: VIT domain-containing protein, partial [Rhodocyclaceae bacterium]|nr:VIT domain-containing protein [Rhodocyclaceae bacterium]